MFRNLVIVIINLDYRAFFICADSNLGLHYLLRYRIDLTNSHRSRHTIKSKIKTYRAVTRQHTLIFPRFQSAQVYLHGISIGSLDCLRPL